MTNQPFRWYQLGKLLLAAEVAQADFHTAVDGDGNVLTDKDGFSS